MKTITAIRDSLNHIPDVFCSTPPELKERGERSGIKTIWKPQINDSVGLVPDYSEDAPSSPPAFEECFEFTVNAKEEDILKVLQGPKGQSLKEAARVIGVDALGWYVPFHYLGSQWGIYLNSIGIVYLAEVLKKIPLDLSSRCTIAASLIHAHEYFHFAHEYMCSQIEGVTGSRCYFPAIDKLKDSKLGYRPQEEELANAFMIRHTARSSKRYQATGKRAEVIKFTKSQGPGYRDGARTYRPNLFEQRLEDYARKSAIECEKINSHAIDAITFQPLYAAFPKVCWKHVPIFLVHDDKSEPLHSLDVHYFGSIQIIQETEKFKKQLNRLSEKLQKKWATLKERFTITTNTADFKMWDRGNGQPRTYSARLDQNYRVHLHYFENTKVWEADSVGNHKEMGHG